jgi:hypothetical protein
VIFLPLAVHLAVGDHRTTGQGAVIEQIYRSLLVSHATSLPEPDHRSTPARRPDPDVKIG